MAAGGVEFTRGGMEAGQENRAKTMVELHNERLRQEKEDIAMKIVRALVPGLTDAVRQAALHYCHLDGEKAAQVLKAFQAENAPELCQLHRQSKKRRREAQRHATTRQQDSGSEDDSSGSDMSERQRKAHRSKKRSRSSKDKKLSSRRKDKRSATDKRESQKKHKKRAVESPSPSQESPASDEDNAGRSTAAATAQFGQYGIIRESDYDAKRGDFMVWAIEVAKVDPEMLPKYEEKELFATYMEDYNTATLPHKKYYDVAAYEAKKRAKAAKRRQGTGERSAFNDEEELRREIAARRAKEQQERLQQAYDELKHTDKAQEMREQQMLRAEMALAYRTGDHAKAERIALRLAPDEVQEKIQLKKELATGKQ